ncbi:MAG: ABC transporter ATP-binding protein [Pseudomonadota bacterium]
MALFEVDNLTVTFDTPDGAVEAVRGISFSVEQGESVAIVGESGSGKSQTMMAAMGLLAANGQASGAVRYRGQNLIGLKRRALNAVRGKSVTMIFQEPMTSLDPLYKIGRQISEPLMVHGGLSAKAANARALDLLKLVQLPEPEERLSAYPYELSGGQRQRVMIAMALANEPDLLIADEPTTALDVTIQAEILGLLAELQTRLQMSILFITHDLGIVEAFCSRVIVMRQGRIVEEGDTKTLFAAPKDAYTKMLLDAEPSGQKPSVAQSAPDLLRADDITVTFHRPGGLLKKPFDLTAVQGVSLCLKKGQTLGVVGESGSGKSTLGRVLVQLQPSAGRVVYAGTDLTALTARQMRAHRGDLQMVFQDPYGSLSPRMTVGEIIAEGLKVHDAALGRDARAERVATALTEVGLEPSMRNRFPHEFSGGQRQRIAIARAIVLRPTVMILDEPTSALDRSVQAQVIALLRDLQAEFDLTYVFISHDLAVVRAIADRVMVMKGGTIVEEGETEAIFDAPQTDYTRDLMRAAFNLTDFLTVRAA